MTHIYFAAPLFSEMDLAYNTQLAERIRQSYPEVTLFLPQEQAEINDKEGYADAKLIALTDTQAVLKSQLVIALLDGLAIDPGVASEIGVAYQAGIPVLALYSDSRQQGATNQAKLDALQEVGESQFAYVNLYTVGLVKLNGQLINNSSDLITHIKDYL